METRTRDRRTRHTFWIDDRIVDAFAPVMKRYPFGTAALAVYAVLARRADRDGDSWLKTKSIAEQAATSERTVQRAVRLLEMLELVEVATCYEKGSQRQTTNIYTLLSPPDPLPAIDPDPKKWPEPKRRILLVHGDSPESRRESVAAARLEQRAIAEFGTAGARPRWAGIVPAEAHTPRQPDTLPPVTLTPSPRQRDTPPVSACHPPGVSLTPLKGDLIEGNTPKEGVSHDNTSQFVIAEVGLSGRQVWAAALAELARRGAVAPREIETWLRPAALVGRDGQTLIVGAPNAVARDRIASRLLPAVRAALQNTIGAPVTVTVTIDR